MIAALVKELPQSPQHRRPLHKDLANIGVHEQVDIPLPVAQLSVGEAVILLRQRQHRLGEKRDRLDMNAQLAGPRAKEISGHANVVAQIEQLVELKALLANRILPDINLQPLAILLQMRKAGLALAANRHQPPGYRDIHPLCFESLGGSLAILRPNLRDGVGRNVLVGISLLPEGGNLLQLFLAQRKQPTLKLRFKHSLASFAVISSLFRQLIVDTTSMLHFGHFNKRFPIIDFVDDAVISNANTPFVVAAFEFLASRWSWRALRDSRSL